MADKQSMLGALASYAEGKARVVSDWWNDLRTFTEKADNEAETRFPGQARDESVKNAYRHALGSGRLAQLLGGTEASRLAAKMANQCCFSAAFSVRSCLEASSQIQSS